MRATLALVLLLAACGDDSAPPANLDGSTDAPIDAPAGTGGTGGGTGGTGGSGGMTEDGGYVPRCNPQCFDPNTRCVDPDGPGGNMPYCGCANDMLCQMTGSCNRADGRCYCGTHLPCVQGLTICVAGNCVPVDAGP